MSSATLKKCMRLPKTKPKNRASGFGDTPQSGSKRRQVRRRSRDAGTNNSMSLTDKVYRAPEPRNEVRAYNLDLVEMAKLHREHFRLKRSDHLTVHFRVRRQNYEQLLWHFISTRTFTKSQIYAPKNLPYWTVCLKLRIRVHYALGKVMESIKYRLGITSPNLKFCLDGFYGMANYADAFGNAGACPWMELSNVSTMQSLGIHSGDSIYMCLATQAQIENVAKWRQKPMATEAIQEPLPSQMASEPVVFENRSSAESVELPWPSRSD